MINQVIYLVDFLGDKAILKERLRKKYRNPALDEKLCKERMRSVILAFNLVGNKNDVES